MHLHTCTCVHVEKKNLFAFIIERSLYRKFSAASNVFMLSLVTTTSKHFIKAIDHTHSTRATTILTNMYVV